MGSPITLQAGALGKGLTGGGESKSERHAVDLSQGAYWRQAFRLQHDPFQKQGLRGLGYMAGQDFMGMGRALGNQQADIAAQSLQDALAARGGGNLASALGMGAQARVGAGLQGLQAGFGMKQQALTSLTGAAQGRLGLQNQLYGMLQGLTTAQVGAGAQTQAAETGAMGQMIAALLAGGVA